MQDQDSSERIPLVDVLPERTRLLHIGLPKTGTTALQLAAGRARAQLLDHGVRYPGRADNHREAVSALMGRELGWHGRGGYRPPIRLWNRLMAEVEREDQRRIWISHEFASESDDVTAQRFVNSIGPRLHVVITLRGFADLLGSSWQQYVKSGYRHSFDRWLRRILSDPPDPRTTPTFYRRNDQAAIVRRWAGLAGSENVTVVIGDKSHPSLLTDAFCDLLGLPRGMLVAPKTGLAANRGMSLAEAEVLRGFNQAIRGNGIDWRDYAAMIRNGAVARLLQSRVPTPEEGRMVLPRWAADRALAKATGYAEAIEASGVRIIGDLETLYAPVATHRRRRRRPVEQVPTEVAVETLAGMMSASMGRGAAFDLSEADEKNARLRLLASERGRRILRATSRSAPISTPDLFAVLGVRAYLWARSAVGRD